MRTVVFVGPTTTADTARALLPEAEIRGPVVCGDVLAVTREGLATIAIVDGLFEHSLPVWHKEILWAISRGCRVYGAASMGALRAAELADFGMIGVGRVFEWYRDGLLEDDDEVAVAHEDAHHSYRVLSDAMVNVRSTLARAVRAGAVDEAAEASLIAIVKATPYPHRNLRRALAKADLPPRTRDSLTTWLTQNGIFDQKRADAEDLFRRIRRDGVDEAAAVPTAFRFSYTEVFHELDRFMRRAVPESSPAPSAEEANEEDLLEELQLLGVERFRDCWNAATERALARALARPDGDEAVRDAVLAELSSVLRDRGIYESMLDRATGKSALLASEHHPAVRVPQTDLIAWHFSALGRPVPEDLDAYARATGFPDRKDLILAIARERWYVDRRRSG
jgi:hypothetical protein